MTTIAYLWRWRGMYYIRWRVGYTEHRYGPARITTLEALFYAACPDGKIEYAGNVAA